MSDEDLNKYGSTIHSNKLFPQKTNVEFIKVKSPQEAILRVFERGVGETLACGTGACAAMVAGNLANKLENDVDIGLKGGHLQVSWTGEGEPVWMTGPAATVYEGKIEI